MRISDPTAAMDQVTAAVRQWARMTGLMFRELVAEGLPEEIAIEIARDWMGILIEDAREAL